MREPNERALMTASIQTRDSSDVANHRGRSPTADMNKLVTETHNNIIF